MQDWEKLLTPAQRAKYEEPMAMNRKGNAYGWDASTFLMTGHFHDKCGIPSPEVPIEPEVADRERRLRLILEEFIELIEAMGFEFSDSVGFFTIHNLELRHIPGSRYDLVETADALADLNVVVNGTALEFGIPQRAIDYEVYQSNLSKIPAGGTAIKNGVTEGYREGEAGYQADKPVGKILKPESYVPANIPAVLKAYYEGKSES